ncbi:MAG: hypothetical protein ACLQBA_16255 [Candidatus Binataceae bacterium]
MTDRGQFVDFMYAVTVGATLPRINDTVLHADSPVLWGVTFLIAVFLEDFYLYHVKVVPHLAGPHSWRGFSLSVLIIGIWYLTQAAFPNNVNLFLVSFAGFFALRVIGGILHRATAYPVRQDIIWTLPIVAAITLLALAGHPFFAGHPGRLLFFLFPSWLLTIVVWWSVDTRLTNQAMDDGAAIGLW